MGCAWHDMIQRAMLGPPLQPIGRHSWACEAGGLLRHDRRRDPLVTRLIKGTTHPTWNIIVVIISNIIMAMYQVFKYYGHHILLVQKFL
jgi:hypothetical protein